jgi:hypothetical protein
MNNYDEIFGETFPTDAGEYTIVAHIARGGEADKHIDLYVGRAADGHHDLIVSDNASMWIVGDEDDSERNQEHWKLITERIGEIDFDAIRDIDEDLADWLEDRYGESDNEMNNYKDVYRIYRIKAGDQFWPKGIISRDHTFIADSDTLDEVRKAFDDYARQTFDDCLADQEFVAALGGKSIEDGDAVAAADAAVDKLRDKFVAETVQTLSLRWMLDTKYLHVCKVREWDNGDENILEML